MAGTVGVWVATVDPAAASPDGCSPDERRRAARFRDTRSAQRWLAGRSVLRRVLGGVIGLDPSAVVLAEEPGGKLFLPDHPLIHTSLSRSADLVVVAVGDRPVGVDVEVDRRLVRPERLADRLIGDPETRRRWAASAEPERTRELLRRWTRLEALLKATGEGLSGGIAQAPDRLADHGYVVLDLDLGRSVMGAVAARGPDWELAGPHPVTG
jgi:4'-phosphopantetheinyl transferase